MTAPTICRGQVTIGLSDDAWVDIFDLSGRRVDRKFFQKGKNSYRPGIPSGIYFIKAENSRVLKLIYLDKTSRFH